MEKKQKEYIVIYHSEEHFEVLGFVKADSLQEARNKVRKELSKEAKHYSVTDAEIAETQNWEEISFDTLS